MLRGFDSRTGMTLVEVLMAVVLVSVAATLVYHGGFYSYRTLMRGRARLEAQGVAFDRLWELFNMSFEDLPASAFAGTGSTPTNGLFGGEGMVQFAVLPETNAPLNWIEYWEISVQVWAPSNSPLFSVVDENGTVQAAYPRPLAEYTLLRYRGDR